MLVFLFYIRKEKERVEVYPQQYSFFSVLLFIFLFVTYYWNNGNNAVNEKVINRLELDEDKGIAGNNRQDINAAIEFYYFMESNSFLWGYGIENYNENRSVSEYDASSVVEFMMRYGALGTVLQMLSIGAFLFYHHRPQYSIPGFLFLLLDFIQHGFGVELSMYILVLLAVVDGSRRDPSRIVML